MGDKNLCFVVFLCCYPNFILLTIFKCIDKVRPLTVEVLNDCTTNRALFPNKQETFQARLVSTVKGLKLSNVSFYKLTSFRTFQVQFLSIFLTHYNSKR